VCSYTAIFEGDVNLQYSERVNVVHANFNCYKLCFKTSAMTFTQNFSKFNFKKLVEEQISEFNNEEMNESILNARIDNKRKFYKFKIIKYRVN